MNIKILFEDDDLAVIEKPAGLIVNDSDTTRLLPTVQSWVKENLKIYGNPESEFARRGGIVHRLDKETSGILIIAKNEESFTGIQKQFKEGSVEKSYIALVHGVVTPDKGEINVPIGRLPWNRMRFGVLPQGRESKTNYEVREHIGNLTLIQAFPKTGRTHQIRVHMQYAGFPLFGDPLYAGRKTARDDRKRLQRHFLHATTLAFNHPKTGERMEFISPLPQDLSDLLKTLKQ